MTRVGPQEVPKEDEKSEEEESLPWKKARTIKKNQRDRTWKEGISHPHPLDLNHPLPDSLHSPFEYFQEMFTVALLEDIVFQTNL